MDDVKHSNGGWEQTRRFALTTRCLLKRDVPAWRVPSTNFLNSPRHRMGAARSRSRCSDASAASLKALGRCASTLGSTKITGAHRVCCPQCPQQGTCPEAVPRVPFGRAPDVRLAAPGSAAARSHGRHEGLGIEATPVRFSGGLQALIKFVGDVFQGERGWHSSYAVAELTRPQCAAVLGPLPDGGDRKTS